MATKSPLTAKHGDYNAGSPSVIQNDIVIWKQTPPKLDFTEITANTKGTAANDNHQQSQLASPLVSR